MRITEALSLPFHLPGFLIQANETRAAAVSRNDEDVTDHDRALRPSPLRRPLLGTILFAQRDHPVRLVCPPVDPEDLTESTDVVNRIVLHKRNTPGARKRKFSYEVIAEFPLRFPRLKRETEKAIPLTKIPVHHEDFISVNRCATETIVNLLFPNDLGSPGIPSGEIQSRLRGDPVSSRPLKLRPVIGRGTGNQQEKSEE